MAEASQADPKPNATTSSSDVVPDEAASISGRTEHETDKDAQEMVIESLRTQVQDLFSQVSQLNNKLVRSYDRVSDLEDDLHVASSNVRSSSLKISQLELERAQHLSALNTGLLVEKSHVTAELSRLMERATDEAAQRGQAESARVAIEKDLDDLSATLFGQANAMVAEARFARHLSERKVEDAERALESAEEAVSIMQQQVQALQEEKELAEKKVQETEALMGKGKWIQRRDSQNLGKSIRLLNSHAPYQEFILFVGHLRALHVPSSNPPAMATLLQLPFLARLSSEDSEPTVRLDLAPSLNWLSRRSVLSAIHTGQLTIEPMASATLLSESASNATSTTVAGLHSSNDNVSCALCGAPVFPPKHVLSKPLRPSNHPLSSMMYSQPPGSWSSSLFKKPTGASHPPTPPGSPSHSPHQYPQQVYIFRLASPPTSSISAIPIPSLSSKASVPSLSKTPVSSSYKSPSPSSVYSGYSAPGSHQPTPSTSPSTTIYPLCTNGWCLSRLRATCSLWAFVRTGIVEHVWEEEVAIPEPPPMIPVPSSGSDATKPPVPPRKRGLWGIASAFSEKAASWGDAERKTQVSEEKKLPVPPPEPSHPNTSTLPPAPPVHPSHVPPPTAISQDTVHAVPPPLPKRSQVRARQAPASPKTGADATTVGEARKSTDETVPKAEPVSSAEASSSLPSQIKAVSSPPPLPQRSHIPANIPLPESRPSTPPVNLNQSSTTGSPVAPPPLPRRAAARGSKLATTGPGSRPNSPLAASSTPVIAETTTTSPDSGTVEAKESAMTTDPDVTAEVPAPAEAATETSEPSKGEDMAVPDAEVPTISISKGTPSSAENEPLKEVSNEKIPARQRLDSQASEEEFVDAPEEGTEEVAITDEAKIGDAETKEPAEDLKATANGDTETEKEKAPVADEEKKLTTVAGDDVGAIEGEEDAVVGEVNPEVTNGLEAEVADEGKIEVAEGGKAEAVNEVKGDVVKEEKEEPRVNGDVKAADKDIKINGIEKHPEEEEDMERYVGHATWEERTWQELVKLREEMFWARVGALRS